MNKHDFPPNNVTVTSDLCEWNYGDYEGLKSAEIRRSRRERGVGTSVAGVQKEWDIWRDGCEGGETPADVTARCDRLIKEIREKFHQPAVEKRDVMGNVLLVAHGHLLRAFALRWVGKELHEGPAMLLEAGGVGTLRYSI